MSDELHWTTVEELIEDLKKLPKKARIEFYTDYDSDPMPLLSVYLGTEGQVCIDVGEVNWGV